MMNSQALLKTKEATDYRYFGLASRILETVLEIGNSILLSNDAISKVPRGSYGFHLSRIQRAVQTGMPLRFILPAFPAKSPNQQKTMGYLPDYGEVLALKRLNDLCSKINCIYPAGAKITICSDGRVFSDLVQVTDSAVNEYTVQIRRIIEENAFTHLSTFCLEDVFDDTSNFEAMRHWLTREYSTPIDELRERIKTDRESRCMFNGVHRFLLEDQLVLYPNETKNKLRDRAKALTYGVIQRSNAWSALLEENFPSAVRLSIHPQLSSAKKIGIRLLPSGDIWRTPWHSVPLYDGTRHVLVTRKQAEEMGATVVMMQEKYPCYVL